MFGETSIRVNVSNPEVMTVDFLKKLLKYCKDKAKPDLSSAAVQSAPPGCRALCGTGTPGSLRLPALLSTIV